MESILDVHPIKRNIIYIGDFTKLNHAVKNNTFGHIVNEYSDNITRPDLPLHKRIPYLIAMPLALNTTIAGVKTLSKKRFSFDYLEVPYQMSYNELKWKDSIQPKMNTFYIMNPRNDRVYFPVEKFHALAFEEKANEAIKILMSLKPKELTVEHEEGYETEISTAVAVSAKAKLIKADGDLRLENNSSKKVLFKASFGKPNFLEKFRSVTLPDDLVWYPAEEKWRSIVEGVLKHNLKDVEMEINYFDDFGMDVNLQADILKQSDSKIKTNVSHFKRTLWKVKASFW